MFQILLFVLSFNLFANNQFTELRNDLTVPKHCREMGFNFFPQTTEYLIFGRENALEAGFTFEYPLKRDNATILWAYFKSVVKGEPNQELFEVIFQDSDLRRDYVIINGNFREMGFDFRNEGEILEILAIHDLYREFPSNQYFITGGVEYQHSSETSTIGEVDLYIGNKDTCEAVVVGEVKLGWVAARQKAEKQLKRFSDFLLNYELAPIGKEYLPKSNGQRNKNDLLKAG